MKFKEAKGLATEIDSEVESLNDWFLKASDDYDEDIAELERRNITLT